MVKGYGTDPIEDSSPALPGVGLIFPKRNRSRVIFLTLTCIGAATFGMCLLLVSSGRLTVLDTIPQDVQDLVGLANISADGTEPIPSTVRDLMGLVDMDEKHAW